MRIPPDQQPSAPPPRGPYDRNTRPHGGRMKHQEATQSGAATSPHQRHGDRGSGDDDASAARCALPTLVRYRDLVESGLVSSWQQLNRMIDGPEAFPPGTMLSPNVRVWDAGAVRRWIESRPTARKVLPPGATPPHRGKRADATADMTP